MTNNTKFNSWHLWLLVVVIIVAIVLGIMQRVGEPAADKAAGPVGLDEITCGDSGGAWNDCGSACRMEDPGTPCIDVCVEYCECTHSDECPYGHQCGNVVEDTGVCLPGGH
ncbi:MAG: hypothetical protein ABIA47_03630 [bacterium]